MERSKALLKKSWRDLRNEKDNLTQIAMLEKKKKTRVMGRPEKSYHDLKDIDTLPDVPSFMVVFRTLIYVELSVDKFK